MRRIVLPKFIELCMETPCWRPSEGQQHGGCKELTHLLTYLCYATHNRALTLLGLNVVKRQVIRGSHLINLKLQKNGYFFNLENGGQE